MVIDENVKKMMGLCFIYTIITYLFEVLLFVKKKKKTFELLVKKGS